MARRRKKKQKRVWVMREETKHSIVVVLFVLLGILFTLAGFGQAGIVGETLFSWMSRLLGVGYALLPIVSFLLAAAFLRSLHEDLFGIMKCIGALLFLAAGLGLVELFFPERGGLLGMIVATPLAALFGAVGTAVVLVALFLISFLIIFDISIVPFFSALGSIGRRERPDRVPTQEEEHEPEVITPEEPLEEETEIEEEPEDVPVPVADSETDGAKESFGGLFSRQKRMIPSGDYTPPPLKLLGKDKGKPGAGDVKAQANIIRRTLANFGIEVEVEEVTVGPSVTRYALKPAEGVRLSKILGLQNNLELALAAHPIRIEAPIPGRSLVGIEVPNSAKTTVGIGALLSTDIFSKATAPLFVALGRDVSGNAHGFDLAKMPHLLIAGATGAGKSVVIHEVITSLLYRNGPDMLKFILIDPKRVELTLYNGIPHLLTPVITDPKKAILALKWLITEMERRYDLFEQHRVRDISSYHANILSKDAHADEEAFVDPMPYIVLVIDELADIMSTYPRELEASIVRLAQMSRAVGIHLILSTQRPSVNVITGLIKANVPGRIALQVASQVDSRTILDMAGAEKLLGAGDILFLSASMAKPVRVQGGFISEEEVKRVTQYLRSHYEDTAEEIELSEGDAHPMFGDTFDNDEEDDLYEEARDAVIEAGKASTSYLQRKLRIGYARAARIMDMLEERGVIGPQDGAKPREVLEDEE